MKGGEWRRGEGPGEEGREGEGRGEWELSIPEVIISLKNWFNSFEEGPI